MVVASCMICKSLGEENLFLKSKAFRNIQHSDARKHYKKKKTNIKPKQYTTVLHLTILCQIKI